MASDQYHLLRGHKLGSWKVEALDMYEFDGLVVGAYIEGSRVAVIIYDKGIVVGRNFSLNASRATTKLAARQVIADLDERLDETY